MLELFLKDPFVYNNLQTFAGDYANELPTSESRFDP